MRNLAFVLVLLTVLPAALAKKERADIIFHNGTILTMDPSRPIARALAVKDGRILAVGSQGEINRLGGPNTRRVNLQRRTLMPGIVDPHSHAILSFGDSEQFENQQQWVLEGGVTSVGNTAIPNGAIQSLLDAASAPGFRVRMGVYLMYNTKCFGLQPENWIKGYPSNHDASQMFRVLGIKLFGDAGKPAPPGALLCGWAATQATIPEYWLEFTNETNPHGSLVLSAQEMADVIAEYQDLGYQAVIHARGDGVVDAALDAIETALDGQPNIYRHRIDHNDLIRPDQLVRYGQVGALPILRVAPNFLGANTCWVENLGGTHPLGPMLEPWSRIVRSVIEANPGLAVSWHSDNGPFLRRTMNDLWQLVTRKEIGFDGHVCEPPAWLVADAPSVEQALRMMTIDAAYTMFLEDAVGSLERGKFADLIVLSHNPLAIDPDALKDITVLMTMVGGKVEHCAEGSGALCPVEAKPGRPR